MTDQPLPIFITTPLEQEHVDRIARVAPDLVEVIFEPDLWPPPRYIADHKGVPEFMRTARQEARWRTHLGRARVLWDFPPPDPNAGGGMALAPNVEWVQTTSSGVGQLVKGLGLHDSGLLVTTARGVHAQPLAEFVFLALLSHVKRLPHVHAEQQAHRWERFCAAELAGLTLAIIGAGKVGQRVAEVGRCFGMRVIGTTRTGPPASAEQLGLHEWFPSSRLRNVLSRADAIVLCTPHTPETENIIDRRAFAGMKPGVVLVNIARGQVVDEPALIEALRTGHVGFAALDVFATEPLPDSSPLWDMPNVLVSPHSASTATTENAKITDIFCHNLRCFLDGRLDEMKNVLDKVRMY